MPLEVSAVMTPSTVDGVITALTSNGMIAPTFWVDPKSGNNYMLTVQYYESQIQSLKDFKQIPLRAAHPVEAATHGASAGSDGTDSQRGDIVPLEAVANVKYVNTPTV